jgi:NAD(P)-dependent dehydrogenase (short-subunit alcohol dehydrogenase family)
MKKSVLITGAAGALGKSVTRKFLENDIPVVGIVGPQDPVDFIQHDLLKVFSGDLSDEKEVRNLFEKISDQDNEICLAVFTVGGFSIGNLADTGLKEIRSMFVLNFETAYLSAKSMYQYFQHKCSGGRMVFIGARPGLTPGEAGDMVAYGLSKSLIFSLAEMINGVGKKDHITAAVIVPGIINTPANRKAMSNADFSKWVEPEHLAEVIYFNYTEAGMELRNPVFKVYGDS